MGVIDRQKFLSVYRGVSLLKVVPVLQEMRDAVRDTRGAVDRLNDSVKFIGERTPSRRMGDKD